MCVISHPPPSFCMLYIDYVQDITMAIIFSDHVHKGVHTEGNSIK